MIKEITKEAASKVIEMRRPQGRFFHMEGDKIIGIDNSTGDAWTEEFTNMKEFLNWITGSYEVTIKLKRLQ